MIIGLNTREFNILGWMAVVECWLPRNGVSGMCYVQT